MLVKVLWSRNIKYQSFPSGGDFKSCGFDTQILGCTLHFNLESYIIEVLRRDVPTKVFLISKPMFRHEGHQCHQYLLLQLVVEGAPTSQYK